MVARHFDNLSVVFSEQAQESLRGLTPEQRNRVLSACESLAELASVAPVRQTPGELQACSTRTAEAEIAYEVRSAERTLWIVRIAIRS